jgi:hypothetical protein
MNRAWSSTCFLSTNTLSEQEYRDLAKWHAEVAAAHARRATNPHCTVIINDHRLNGLGETGRYKVADIIEHEVRLALGDHCLYCSVDAGSSAEHMRVRITTNVATIRE